MPDLPASPRATRLATPGWLDRRLVLGVLLVLVSVVVGARVLAAADTATPVWVAARDLAPGSTLAAGDVRPARVRLDGSGTRYVLAVGPPPVGYVLARGVGGGELLPRAALSRPGQAQRAAREVSVPVPAGHLPEDLLAGQLVDVYVTPGSAAATAPAAGGTRRVLAAVPVALRPRTTGLAAGGSTGVVLSVADGDAAGLVGALQEGRVDLVRVPSAGPPADLAPVAGS